MTVPGRDGAPDRKFFARLYHFDWSHEERQCLYAGNNQVGAKESEQTDPVISGSYQDYAVDGVFGYKFGLFNQAACGWLLVDSSFLLRCNVTGQSSRSGD